MLTEQPFLLVVHAVLSTIVPGGQFPGGQFPWGQPAHWTIIIVVVVLVARATRLGRAVTNLIAAIVELR